MEYKPRVQELQRRSFSVKSYSSFHTWCQQTLSMILLNVGPMALYYFAAVVLDNIQAVDRRQM